MHADEDEVWDDVLDEVVVLEELGGIAAGGDDAGVSAGDFGVALNEKVGHSLDGGDAPQGHGVLGVLAEGAGTGGEGLAFFEFDEG